MVDVRLELSRDSTGEFKAGDSIEGRVAIKVQRPTACQGLTLQLNYRTHGKSTVDRGDVEPIRLPIPDSWEPGEVYRYPFDLTAPAWPVSYAGEWIQLEWRLTATADMGSTEAIAHRAVTVLPGPDTLKWLAEQPHEARRSATPALLGLDLTCATVLAVAAIAAGVVAVLGEATVAVPAVLTGLLLGSFAVWGFVTTLRNPLAQRKLGPVFVGLPAKVAAGEPLACLLHLQPPLPLQLNGVSADLVCEEVSTIQVGSDASSSRKERLRIPLTLLEGRLLRAKEEVDAEVAFEIPRDAPISFKLDHNQIEWTVKIRIDIPGWPDWVHSYPVRVDPTGEMRVDLTKRQGLAERCPYCRDEAKTDQALTTCGDCRTVLHLECMRELGRCTTAGCHASAPTRARAR